MQWVVDRPGLKLGLGNSQTFDGDADLVFTHPYCILPKCLKGKPAIINIVTQKKAMAEAWVGAELVEVTTWGGKVQNTVYVANMEPVEVDCTDLVEDEFQPRRGWFPLELPLRLLRAFRASGTIWDGFMGRATIGRACEALGLGYIGIDMNPERVAIAREYLGC
jgi:hypothetical protein